MVGFSRRLAVAWNKPPLKDRGMSHGETSLSFLPSGFRETEIVYVRVSFRSVTVTIPLAHPLDPERLQYASVRAVPVCCAAGYHRVNSGAEDER
jgi:hypothetical protein